MTPVLLPVASLFFLLAASALAASFIRPAGPAQSAPQLQNLAYSSPYQGAPQLAVAPPVDETVMRAAAATGRQQAAPGGAFQHGVASGDPTASAVVVWTKVSPRRSDNSPIAIQLIVSANSDLSDPVANGSVRTSSDIDWTVKADIGGLTPDTEYYYRFEALDSQSPTGRTRTMPSDSTAVDSVKFALVSCATYWHGYFHGYKSIAEQQDIAFVVHLGDYIYEYALEAYPPVGPRLPDRDPRPPSLCITLDDYRTRHAQYKTDPDLQAMHRVKPMLAVWDDHEFADNAWWGGAPGHDADQMGAWADRRRAAARAWWEYLPTRPVRAETRDQAASIYRIYRTFQIGNLATLILLDTRIVGRDQQNSGDANDRSLLGPQQRQWLFQELSNPNAKWKLIGNQVMFSPKPEGLGPIDVNVLADDWNGYPMARQEVLEHIRTQSIENVVMFTGDFHSSLVSNVMFRDPDEVDNEGEPRPYAFVEFIGPSITSKTPVGGSQWQAEVVTPLFYEFNPGLQALNLIQHGFMVATVDHQQVAVSYHYVEDIKEPDGGDTTLNATWIVASGSQRVTKGEHLLKW